MMRVKGVIANMAQASMTTENIANKEVKEVIDKVIQLIESRQHLRRNPSKYATHDPEVLLELDVLKIHIIKNFSN